nr:immunoglobulin heavy chain junction region [Mus musculus]
CAREDGFAYW